MDVRHDADIAARHQSGGHPANRSGEPANNPLGAVADLDSVIRLANWRNNRVGLRLMFTESVRAYNPAHFSYLSGVRNYNSCTVQIG